MKLTIIIPAAGQSTRFGSNKTRNKLDEVIVADGALQAAKRLKRVLTNDPMLGIFRHVDAGYDDAIKCAQQQGVQIPLE